jgi:hypothetical protein
MRPPGPGPNHLVDHRQLPWGPPSQFASLEPAGFADNFVPPTNIAVPYAQPHARQAQLGHTSSQAIDVDELPDDMGGSMQMDEATPEFGLGPSPGGGFVLPYPRANGSGGPFAEGYEGDVEDLAPVDDTLSVRPGSRDLHAPPAHKPLFGSSREKERKDHEPTLQYHAHPVQEAHSRRPSVPAQVQPPAKHVHARHEAPSGPTQHAEVHVGAHAHGPMPTRPVDHHEHVHRAEPAPDAHHHRAVPLSRPELRGDGHHHHSAEPTKAAGHERIPSDEATPRGRPGADHHHSAPEARPPAYTPSADEAFDALIEDVDELHAEAVEQLGTIDDEDMAGAIDPNELEKRLSRLSFTEEAPSIGADTAEPLPFQRGSAQQRRRRTPASERKHNTSLQISVGPSFFGSLGLQQHSHANARAGRGHVRLPSDGSSVGASSTRANFGDGSQPDLSSVDPPSASTSPIKTDDREDERMQIGEEVPMTSTQVRLARAFLVRRAQRATAQEGRRLESLRGSAHPRKRSGSVSLQNGRGRPHRRTFSLGIDKPAREGEHDEPAPPKSANSVHGGQVRRHALSTQGTCRTLCPARL